MIIERTPDDDAQDAAMDATIEAMMKYGGGFVQGLGALYRRADAENQRRLASAFPDYFAKYRALAQGRPCD